MKIKRIELAVFLLLAILMTYCAAVSLQQYKLSEQVIRIRVVADADDMISQSKKLHVRDAVLAFCDDHRDQMTTAEDANRFLSNNMNALRECVRAVLGKEQFCISLAETRYPSRSYQRFSLPAGRYHGLQIYIGSAEGKNWWCVVYPALCTDTDLAAQHENVVFSFKCAEMLNELYTFLWS